jgi:hypothetical protein
MIQRSLESLPDGTGTKDEILVKIMDLYKQDIDKKL